MLVAQVRSMKRARDVREQLLGLLERVEIELVSDTTPDPLKKAITSGVARNDEQACTENA